MHLGNPETKKSMLAFMRKVLFRPLPDRLFVFLDYLISRRKIPDVSNPRTLSDKIIWIKIYGGLERYSRYVDKYEVRDFIKETIGEEHLIPLIGVWEKAEDIPFHALPERFVLKATHGAGYVLICKDRSLLDRTASTRTLAKWLREDYYLTTREIQYKHCRPRIVCEEYLEDESGGLKDYKFFCFDGKPQLIQVDSDRFFDHKQDVFDLNWNRLPFTFSYPSSGRVVERPSNLDEMIGISEALSIISPFVRVDLYSAKDRVYFGELTLTPGGGVGKISSSTADHQLGRLINLQSFSSRK